MRIDPCIHFMVAALAGAFWPFVTIVLFFGVFCQCCCKKRVLHPAETGAIPPAIEIPSITVKRRERAEEVHEEEEEEKSDDLV